MQRIILFITLALVSCKKDPIQYSLKVSPIPDVGGFVNPTSGIYDAGANVQGLVYIVQLIPMGGLLFRKTLMEMVLTIMLTNVRILVLQLYL